MGPTAVVRLAGSVGTGFDYSGGLVTWLSVHCCQSLRQFFGPELRGTTGWFLQPRVSLLQGPLATQGWTDC